MIEERIVVKKLMDRKTDSVSLHCKKSTDLTLVISWLFSPNAIKLKTALAKSNNLVGGDFICSMPQYITNITESLDKWLKDLPTNFVSLRFPNLNFYCFESQSLLTYSI